SDPVSARLVAHWSARCGDPHLGQCHRAADEMVAATPLFCRWRAGNSCHWRSARYDLLHRQQLERSRARQMRKSVHQEWGARWNQSSRWKSLFADRRTWSVDQRQAGGIRRAGCDNQRKANRARRFCATSSRRNSEIVIASGRSSRECDEVIHSILDVMYANAPYTMIQRAMHIHPTVSELIPTMLSELKPLK